MNSDGTHSLDSCIISTRYRGSKTKIIPYIWNIVKDLNFESVLDCFGGTGSVSYLFKKKHKQVLYNDHLRFNHIVGRALIENS
ncbi:MAG: DNA methyltransferase, partial [Candidatus Lokiarchaeota archaeon]|nr:DNA methyltransferase [Candidatus Lokiarchaeota archaeon]